MVFFSGKSGDLYFLNWELIIYAFQIAWIHVTSGWCGWIQPRGNVYIYINIYIYMCSSRVVSMLLHLSYVDSGFSHVEGPWDIEVLRGHVTFLRGVSSMWYRSPTWTLDIPTWSIYIWDDVASPTWIHDIPMWSIMWCGSPTWTSVLHSFWIRNKT